jgi:hypothetical protein
MTVHNNLQPLALQILSDGFVDGDYHFGNKVIADAMVIWTSKMIHCPYDYIQEFDKVNFSKAAKEQKRVWDILSKWSSQYWEYYRQVEHEKSERFTELVSTLDDPNMMVKAKSVRSKILDVLESLHEESGIRFMAILTVEWARKFNSQGFLQMVHALGYSPSSEAITDGSYLTVSALRFMDMEFQLA